MKAAEGGVSRQWKVRNHHSFQPNPRLRVESIFMFLAQLTSKMLLEESCCKDKVSNP